MPGSGDQAGTPRPGKPTPGSTGKRPGSLGPKPARRTGGLGLKRVGGNEFELTHPRCVPEMELDYIEGVELRREGDPEGARDALRYALQGCGDNLWVHVALGWVALEDFRDPTLARGHFGYGFELGRRAIPADFSGRLPLQRPSNRPFYDAIDGLIACYTALDQADKAAELRALADRWASGRG